jgi:hypothetical protein
MRILTNIGLMFLAPATLLGLFDFIFLLLVPPSSSLSWQSVSSFLFGRLGLFGQKLT